MTSTTNDTAADNIEHQLRNLQHKAVDVNAAKLQAQVAKIRQELRMAKYIASIYEEAEQELKASLQQDASAGQESFSSLDDFFRREDGSTDGFTDANSKADSYQYYWETKQS